MTPPARSPASARIRVALAAVLVLGAALRLYDLGSQSTWVDELSRIVWSKGYEFDRWFGFLPGETGARLPPRGLGQALRVVNAHNPPLYGALLNAWMRATGSESDFAARLPSALLGVLSVLGMFLAARQVLGARAAVWAAALVAFSPFHVFYAQEVNHYTLAACLVAFSLWFHLRWLERPAVVPGVGLALTGLGALYAHYFAAIALGCQGLGLLVRHRRAPRRLALAAVPYLAIAAGFAPYLRTLSRQLVEMTHPAMVGTFQGAGYFAERMQAIGVVPWLGERGEHLPPLAGLPIVALAVALFVVGLRAVGDRPLRRVLLLNAVGPLVVVVALFWTMRGNSIVWTRYQLVFTFAQLIPIAAALDAGRRSRWLAAPALAVLAAIGLRFQLVELVKEDWEGAAAAISSRGSKDDAVLVYRPNLAYAVGRYLPPENRIFGIEEVPDPSRLIAAAAAGRAATWFVSAWATSPALPAKVHAVLACRYARREDFPVPPGRVGLTVTRYSEPYGSAGPAPGAARVGEDACAPGEAVEPWPWERASGGPVVEAGLIDVPAPGEPFVAVQGLPVSGWAFSTRGIRSLVFEVDGRAAQEARHLGMPRPDVAGAYPAAPATHGLHAGFWALVDVQGALPGVHSLAVTAVHQDGSRRRLASREFHLKPPGAQDARRP